ncbi:MAG: SGNH/GDSL hydrolase family protein [Bacteroidetes bacterium]|nr:SGNH/GDSL hydrolase family protein [Bacteroidota bacterium]
MKCNILIYISIISIFGIACNNNTMKNKSYSYLALGDSYTIGQSIPTKESFPIQLANSLKQNNISISEPQIIAKTGWTTDELSIGIDTSKVLDQYDLVTLLIGVNNQYRGRSIENYRKEFNQLLNKSIKFAGNDQNKVIVISIPDWSVTPFAKERDAATISKEIEVFNTVNLEESTKLGVQYVNITDISRKTKTDSTLLAEDGLHPSAKMYALWVQEILPKALSILTKEE